MVHHKCIVIRKSITELSSRNMLLSQLNVDTLYFRFICSYVLFYLLRGMQAVSSAIGKDASVFLHWTVTWLGSYTLALWKGWKLALACLALSPILIICGAVMTRVSGKKYIIYLVWHLLHEEWPDIFLFFFFFFDMKGRQIVLLFIHESIEPQCEKLYLLTYAPKKDADQPAHPCNLISLHSMEKT